MEEKAKPSKWAVSHSYTGTFGVVRTWHKREDGKVRITRVQWYGRPRRVFQLRSEAQAVADRKNAE